MTLIQKSLKSATLKVGLIISAFIVLLITPYSTNTDESKSILDSMIRSFFTSGNHGDWQHCMLIPFIVGFLLFQNRKTLSTELSNTAPTNGGLILVSLSLLLYFLGYMVNLHYLGYFSIQLLFASVIIWFFNWSFFFKNAFYWWFLWFVWPFYFLGRMLGLPLRLIMTWLSEKLLTVLQLDPVREGTAILSEADPFKGLLQGELYQVEVAVACSGLRSLFALMMISALFGFLKTKSGKWQWVYFLSSIPLAIFGNCCRILILVLATLWFGEDFAIGKHSEEYGEEPSAFHLFAGYFVFVFNIAGLLLLEKLIKKLPLK